MLLPTYLLTSCIIGCHYIIRYAEASENADIPITKESWVGRYGDSAEIRFLFPGKSTGIQSYAVKLLHKLPGERERYRSFQPYRSERRYEVKLSDNLSVEEQSDRCPSHSSGDTYCYRCHSAEDECQLYVTIKSAKPEDAGSYKAVISDGSRSEQSPISTLVVIARPQAIYHTFEGKRYENGGTIPLRICENNTVSTHVENYSPRITPRCYANLDKLDGPSNNVASFSQNSTTNLYSYTDILTIIPKDTLDVMRCNLMWNREDIDGGDLANMEYYFFLPGFGTTSSQSGLKNGADTPLCVLVWVLVYYACGPSV